MDGRNPLRTMRCPLCAGGRVFAVYRSHSTIYLACDGCWTIWPVEVSASELPLDATDECQEREDVESIH